VKQRQVARRGRKRNALPRRRREGCWYSKKRRGKKGGAGRSIKASIPVEQVEKGGKKKAGGAWSGGGRALRPATCSPGKKRKGGIRSERKRKEKGSTMVEIEIGNAGLNGKKKKYSAA